MAYCDPDDLLSIAVKQGGTNRAKNYGHAHTGKDGKDGCGWSSRLVKIKAKMSGTNYSLVTVKDSAV